MDLADTFEEKNSFIHNNWKIYCIIYEKATKINIVIIQKY